MGQAVEEILGDRISAGAITVKYGHGLPLKKIKVFEAGHPVPDQATLEGTAAILNLLKGLNEDDLVLALITGGGSALLELPAGSLTLEDLQATTQALLASGADITEMNAVRRHLSQVKGGRLAQAAHPARLVTLAVSDVIGDPPESISSGPTAPDPSTFADAWRVIEKYSLQDKLPQAVIKHLREGAEGKIPDTPKKDDFVQEEEVRHSCLTEDSNSDRQECLSSTYKVKRNDRQECLSSTNKLKLRASYHIIGSNRIMLEAARQEAEKLGYQTEVLTDRLSGEAREQGRQLARLIKEKQVSGKPVCLLAGGEPTVTIRGEGKGGRNQELALAAAIELAGSHDCLLLSAGSDGTDGPTDAAGALADGTTIHRAEALSLNAQDYLDRNDSYPFFQALGDLVITGPTRTNVMDIIIMLSI
jgi:hydroxypyruvate reductase